MTFDNAYCSIPSCCLVKAEEGESEVRGEQCAGIHATSLALSASQGRDPQDRRALGRGKGEAQRVILARIIESEAILQTALLRHL